MSNMSETSLWAYHSLDLAACERELIDWMSKRGPGYAATRQTIAKLMGKELSWVCGRANALLKADILESLDAVDGRHPLRLKNAAGQMPVPATVGRKSDQRSPLTPPTIIDESVPAAPEHAPRSPQCDGNLTDFPPEKMASHGARSVVPYLPHRISMSLDVALRSTGREAELVRKLGKPFRVWGTDLELCFAVAEIVNRKA